MSDRYSDNQPWLRHSSDQTVLAHPAFAFNYSEPSAINGRGGEHLLLRSLQHIKYFIPNSPPTTNLRIGMSSRGGAKAYYRFHGGIGDGRGGKAIEDNVVARPLQLFEALDPLAFEIDMIKKVAADQNGSVKNPVTESSAGTGVFLPVYPTTKSKSKWKWIPSTKVLNNNGGMCGNDVGDRARGDHAVGDHGGGKKKQENSFKKRFAEKEEHKDLDEIPIELLLPSEWTY